MEDSKLSLRDHMKQKGRIAALGLGAFLILVGLVIGLWQRYDLGTYLMVAGIVFIQASEFGRPVFINIWNQMND